MEDTPSSDIDILIDVAHEAPFTLFDIAEIQEKLRHALNRQVDLVMLRALRPQVKKSVNDEFKLIYEKR